MKKIAKIALFSMLVLSVVTSALAQKAPPKAPEKPGPGQKAGKK